MSSSPVLSLLLLLLLVTTTITTAEAAKAKTVRAPPPPSSAIARQAAPSSTNGINNTSLALATPGHSGPTASEILLPAMRTLVGGPLRLLRQLAAELVAFLRAHRPLPLQLYDHRFWGSVATALPARASAYWSALVSMESSCARRTVCDLAELASRRLPKWAQQAVLFYLNAFAETNEFYGVAISGLTLKNCRSFEDCDADRLFARLQGNVTEAIKATVGPVGAAFADLVEVASTTMRSIVTGEEREDLRRPQPQPQQDSLRAPAPASRTFEEEAEEEEDEEPVMMGGSGRRPPLPMMASSSSSSSGGVMNRLPVAQPSHHFPRH